MPLWTAPALGVLLLGGLVVVLGLGWLVSARRAKTLLADQTTAHATALAALQHQLQTSQAELDQHRHHLQGLVAQRTAELAAANASLAQQQQFVRTLTDALPAVVGYVDRDGRYRFTNRGYESWYGVPAKQVLGRTVRQMLGEAAYALNEPHILAVMRGEPQSFQRTFPRHDGVLRHVQIVFVPNQDEAGVHGYFTLSTDVSDIKSAELKLQQLNDELVLRAAQAESATLAKSAFLANMSHEIRTPMNAIIGLTHLMARDTRDTLQRDRLAKVDAAAKHLLQVINDVLDLSKIEAGKMTLEQSEFSLESLLAGSFEMVGQRARDKGIELIVDADHLPERLRGDATRLRQALVNLLANAVKFTDRGWVRLRGTLLGETRSRQHLRFEVQDTGEGITPQALPRLFDAFEQADSSTTRRHGGTGLGLALTRHLVHLMDGEMGVTSQPGEGSTFWFTAWLDRAGEAGDHAAPLAVQGLRVLVVDDLPEALASVADRLAMMGLQVHTAPGAAQALAQVQATMTAGQPFDLLLIDWRMPLMDGIDTRRQLQAMLQGGTPPCILISAFDEPAMWQQARAVQFDAVLVKPITPSALHDTLMRVLRRQAVVPALAGSTAGQAEALLRRRHAGQRVLLVEDNPINQEVADELLRAAGLVVDVADDGERAVELACSRAYDAVLMDMQMPVMDGLNATRTIRHRLGSGLSIIAMTANAFGDDRAACLGAGMNDHIAKPVDPEHLYLTLLRWLPLRQLDSAQRPPQLDTAPATAAPAAPAQPKPLAERLGSVEGFNIRHAQQAVMGQWPVLARVLGSFVNTYGGGTPALVQAARTADWSACKAQCHSLRGACAAVGADGLAAQAEALELAVNSPVDGAALVAQAGQLHQALRQFSAQLRDALA